MDHGSRRAIIAAFLANLGIALSKFVAFALTGAASMLAEAIHSLADTGNQGLLMLGGARSRRPADDAHPFGYGSLRYFWAFVVALVLFSVGGVVRDLRRHREAAASARARRSRGGDRRAARERRAWSRSRCAPRSTRVADEREGRSILQFVRRTKIPELPVVVLEDIGALVGLAFAFVGIVLARACCTSRAGTRRAASRSGPARRDRDRARDRDGEPARRRGRRARDRRADPHDSRRPSRRRTRDRAAHPARRSRRHHGEREARVRPDAHARRGCPRS